MATVERPQNAYQWPQLALAGSGRHGSGVAGGPGGPGQQNNHAPLTAQPPNAAANAQNTARRPMHIDARAGTAPHTSQRKHSGALWLRCSALLVQLPAKSRVLRALGDGEAAPRLVALWGGSAGLTEARVRFLPGVTDCSRCRLRVTCACVRACVRACARACLHACVRMCGDRQPTEHGPGYVPSHAQQWPPCNKKSVKSCHPTVANVPKFLISSLNEFHSTLATQWRALNGAIFLARSTLQWPLT